MQTRSGRLLTLFIVCTASLPAAAWACEQAQESSQKTAAPAPAVGDSVASRVERGREISQSRTENGMQVIELAPSQRTTVYATVGPDGKIAVSHSPAVEPSPCDD